MARALTRRMAEALVKNYQRIILCEIDHPDGMFRAWSGIGTLDYDGEDWIGLGVLGTIAPVKATTALMIQEVVFSLSGIDAQTLALLDGHVRNREATVWLACMDERGLVVADPWQLLVAQMDYQQFEASEDGTSRVSIIARSGFYTMERALNEVWSPENQKLTYPDDTGFDKLPTLQNKELVWKMED